MRQLILNESDSIWKILPEGEDCVQLINNTERQVWFIVLSSIAWNGIAAFHSTECLLTLETFWLEEI